MSKIVYLILAVITVVAIILAIIFLNSGNDKTDFHYEASNTKLDELHSFISRDPAPGDAFATVTISEPINLIPAISSDSASHDVTSYIYNGLVKYNKNLELVGDLASSWEISDDKMEITFHLRKDVKWHDGVPFTAKDVEFTYRFMIDNLTPTSYDADFRLIESFKVIDNHTVTVRYKTLFSPALNSWGIWMMPQHLLDGKLVTQSALQRMPIGTGPYKMLSWSEGDSIQLIVNEDYFESKPYLERIIFRVIPDTATSFLELLNGSIDTMSLSAMQATKQTNMNRYKENYNTYSYLDSSYTYVGFNLRRAPFDNSTLRKALSYATPKKDIITGILYDRAEEATGPYKTDTMWYNGNVERYDYNPEKAVALLKEIGYEDTDDDGFLDKDGKKFEFEILTNQGNKVRSQIAEILQKAYKDIGIDVTIRIVEWSTFLSENINKGRFSVIVMGWNIVQDPDLFDVWHSSRCDGKGLNFICYKNDEVDELLIEGRETYEPSQRQVIYNRIQELIADDAPYIFLYTPYANVALSKRFKNIEPAPAGLKHNLIDWYVRKLEQKYYFKQ